MTNPATVTVVTGPPGADIGPLCAWLGRDLTDGLAIRVLPNGSSAPHTSPNPHVVGFPSVALFALPSAWQDDQTNLGVAYAGRMTDDLATDLFALERLGLAPHHRVTVQPGRDPKDAIRATLGSLVPPPVEVGNLLEAARDSVLRGSADGTRHVLIEAGGGQTLLDALHTVGIPPWAGYVHVLDLWLMVDAMHLLAHLSADFAAADRPHLAAARLNAEAQNLLRANGGRIVGAGPLDHLGDGPEIRMRLAVRNVQAVIPELTGATWQQIEQRPDAGGPIADGVLARFADFVLDLEGTADVHVGAVSTGPEANSPWIDLRGRF